jgi:hypothetical protein
MPKGRYQYSTEDFIKIVKENHGDIYTFEKTIFNGSGNPVTVTCVKHKYNITIIAEVLLRRTERNGGPKKNPIVGSCPMCRTEYFESIKNEMLKRFRVAHNNEYEYEGYVNLETPFTAICKKHGKFKVRAESHLRGTGKCPTCYPHKKEQSLNYKIVDGKDYYVCDIHGDVSMGKYRKLFKGYK